eukprot:SAG11_NODE_3450_length_2441_cov_1.382579_3_plen_131_part_00
MIRAVNEMLVAAPNDGSFIELFPYFPANESAAFATLRTKGGWLVSASKARATAAEIAAGGRGAVMGVEIIATVGGTAQLLSPWPTMAALPAVVCHPPPAAPAVRRVQIAPSGRAGVAWPMAVGQVCRVNQ